MYDRRLSKQDRLQCELMLDRDGDVWFYPINYDLGVAYLDTLSNGYVSMAIIDCFLGWPMD